MKTTSKAAMVAAAAGAVPALTVGCSGSGDSQFDVLIKGGTVYDGTLADPKIMDVALKDSRIAAVGKVEGRRPKRSRPTAWRFARGLSIFTPTAT